MSRYNNKIHNLIIIKNHIYFIVLILRYGVKCAIFMSPCRTCQTMTTETKNRGLGNWKMLILSKSNSGV
jgi:hypothetical protein